MSRTHSHMWFHNFISCSFFPGCHNINILRISEVIVNLDSSLVRSWKEMKVLIQVFLGISMAWIGAKNDNYITCKCDARIMNSHIIWRWNNAGIENSRMVPKMRESDTLRTEIGARMGSFSRESVSPRKKKVFIADIFFRTARISCDILMSQHKKLALYSFYIKIV